MTSLGQIDGGNVRIEFRLAEGHAERFPELAHSFVRDRASVIVASGDAAVRAAQQATKTIPIIAIVDEIVGSGLIASLAKPGSNTTGVSILATELVSWIFSSGLPGRVSASASSAIRQARRHNRSSCWKQQRPSASSL
jgi:ABC transporter substrate binding protein